MKTCPKCQKTFPDELNFCLEDGVNLIESESYDAEQTLAFSREPTLQLSGNEIITQPQVKSRQTFPSQKLPQTNRLLGIIILAIVGLPIVLVIGGYYYLWWQTQEGIVDPPDIYQQSPTATPTPTPTPVPENFVKVEILEKATDRFGRKFLKLKVTNISDKVIELSFPHVNLTFYQGNVKIGDSRAEPLLKVLKPNQTIPVWADLRGMDNYTSVKVKESINAKLLTKPLGQIFPSLEFSQTEMKNRITYYTVSGIVENQRDEKISTDIVAIFYDEKSEIVGFGSTSVFNLPKGEKTKFELQNGYLFGKPKTFELIAISSR